ncbi:hypothetical protein [Pontibacter sp. G13]|uniref:hypothetical protein n=1 Tax=Pontibacter sp. G13 TaxID=3074898 RepID=UPI00288A0A3A|nr:hypothetical protein [Pontibacter sp. G13]WNJ16357.1 hypothetical protein RJD25_15950 [Pontibacter sp. G13]
MIRSLDISFQRWGTWILLGLGLLVRIAYAIWAQDLIWEGDAGDYVQEAESVLRGTNFQLYWPPGLPHLLALGMAIFGGNPSGAILSMLAMYMLLHVSLNRVLDGQAPAFLKWTILAILAFQPSWIHHSVAPLTQLPVALCLVVVWKSWRGICKMRSGLWRPWMWAGIALGMAALIRPACLALIPIWLFGTLGWMIAQRNVHWKLWAFSLLIAFTLIGTWELRAHALSGRWVLINDANAYNLFIGNHAETPPYRTWWLGSHDERSNPQFANYYSERDSIEALPADMQAQAWSEAAWKHIRSDWWRFGIRTASRLRTFWGFDTYVAGQWMSRASILGVIILLGDAICYICAMCWAMGEAADRSSWTVARLGLLGLIAVYAAPYALAFSHPTYHLALMPLIWIWGARMPDSWGKMWKNPWVILAWGLFLAIQLEWARDLLLRP